MHLVRLMIEGASLVFIAAMPVYEYIAAESIFGILYGRFESA